MKIAASILLYLLATAPFTVHAQKIYICKDASARTFTSDRPVPECSGRAVREMDKNGIVRREIPAPLTAEQKRQKQEEEEKRKADEAVAAEKKQNDIALLARYRSESDIALARKRTVDLVQEQIKRESGSLTLAEKRKKDAQTELTQLKNKKDIPPGLNRRIEDADLSIASTKEKIKAYETEAAQIEAKFDVTLKRYRELTGSTASK